ncbi:MAG TPA: ABC transporter ATP-binding protein [Firmicutes bacterium]|nr:ABC transporter ATP-binding protein [Bacillota bacterium]
MSKGMTLRLGRLLRPYIPQMLLGVFSALVVSSGNLLLPLIFGRGLVDQVLLGLSRHSLSRLNVLALLIILLTAAKGIFTYSKQYFLGYVGHRFAMDLRALLFDRLQEVSLEYHEREKSGESVVRMTGDVTILQGIISGTLAGLISDGVTLLGILIFTFYLHWKLALLTVLLFPFIGLMVGRFGERVRQFTRQMQDRMTDITTIIQETLLGIRIVKAFTLEEHEKRRFARENRASFFAGLRSVQVQATISPLVELLVVGAMTGVIWYGAREVLAGRLTAGDLVAFLSYAGMASAPVAALSQQLSSLQQGRAAAERIDTLFAAPVRVTDSPQAVPLPPLSGRVRFRHVTFGYEPGRPVLHDVSFEVEPGQVVALVGPSGAGKSTLVHLLLRFYDPDEGSIEVDGYDLRRVTLRSLRQQIGFVPQETVVFGVSVRENIACGRPGATEEEIVAAARAANADDFIRRLPQGYDTILGERGINLSGGERQRLAIARALLRQPRILILDEATASLDAESEHLVQEALERLLSGRTTFIIAHRFSTIERADLVVVLDRGRLVESGPPGELLRREGSVYRRLHQLQFGSALPARAGAWAARTTGEAVTLP